jgi:hypothetical protein
MRLSGYFIQPDAYGLRAPFEQLVKDWRPQLAAPQEPGRD